MNPIAQLVIVGALVVLAVTAGMAWFLWRNYRPAPERELVVHVGADEPYGDFLHELTGEQWPALMSHDEYVAAGYTDPAGFDPVNYASGGAFQPVEYAVEGELVEDPDLLIEPVFPQADARIFDTLIADFGPINLDWQPSWASSYTQYMRVLGPTYALPAGERDFTGSFAVVAS